MDIITVSSAFFMILLAELGDKTQLTVISLSCSYPTIHVFIGSMLGFLFVDGISIILGASLTSFIPITLITLASGVIFIAFGLMTLYSKKAEEDRYKASGRSPLLSSFSLIALGELGDKTQIASIALAAERGWDSVLVGVMMAFVILVSLGCVFGSKVLSRFPKRTLRIGTAFLFIILGIVSVASVLLGFSLF